MSIFHKKKLNQKLNQNRNYHLRLKTCQYRDNYDDQTVKFRVKTAKFGKKLEESDLRLSVYHEPACDALLIFSIIEMETMKCSVDISKATILLWSIRFLREVEVGGKEWSVVAWGGFDTPRFDWYTSESEPLTKWDLASLIIHRRLIPSQYIHQFFFFFFSFQGNSSYYPK